MTPESEEARTRVLFAACGFMLVALVALGVLLLLGLKRPDGGDAVFAPRSKPRPAAAVPTAQEQARKTAKRRSQALSAEIPSGQLFSPASFWNKRLPDTTPLDPSSATLVQALVAEVQRERTANIGPWIGASAGSTPLYRVGPAVRPVRVHLDRAKIVHGGRALQRAFASVPIPRDARAAGGPDRHMTVWQPSSDKLWDFYGARRRSDGWHALWGGAIRHVSKSPGYYTRAAWRGATRNWGATASSLPVIGGTMLLDELKAGRIDHALAINLPAPRAKVFAWPAQRTDGTGPPTALPEGARLRLDPSLDVSALHLPKLARMMAFAAQRYGIVVRDQTHHAISFFAENPTRFSGRPYARYFRGRTPQQLLANFPWDRLQVLKMRLCTRAPCNSR